MNLIKNMIISKKIQVGDICKYIIRYNGSIPNKYYNHDCGVINVTKRDVSVKFEGDKKKYTVQRSELKLIKRPKNTGIKSLNDPYAEERWDDVIEYEDAELEKPGRIKKFLQFLKGGDDDNFESWMNREINQIDQ